MLERSPLLALRLVQQAAVARLGELALDAVDPDALMAQTIDVISSTLDADLVGIAELQPDGREFLLDAGAGFTDGLVRNMMISAEWNESQAGFTLATGQPTVAHDYHEEDRFSASDLLTGYGARSGVTVLIGGRDKSFGVLGAFSREVAAFSEDDIAFLQSVANVLAHAIDRWHVEDLARRQALRDQLTGLPNRSLGLDRISHAMARHDRDGLGQVALIVVDVDRFSVINNSLGHKVGDLLLAELASRLRRAMRPGDTVARFGGDEFVILCDVVENVETALQVAERVSAVIAQPFAIDRDDFVISSSIGVVMRDGSRRGGRGPVARRVRRAQPRQGARPRPRRAVRLGRAHASDRPPANRGRSAPRDRARRAATPLPGDRVGRRPPRARVRGARALGAPGPGTARPRAVHPGRRGERPDRRPRPLRAARGMRDGGELARAE